MGPSHGAEYNFLADADMVEKTQFKSGSATGVAETVRSFETQRDLVTVVENKWLSPAATLSKYEYHYDDLGRRTDVATTGAGFNLDRFTLFTYNDRSELLTSKRYNGTDLQDLSNPVAAQQYTFNFDPIGNRTNYTGEDPPVTTTYTANNLNQYSSTSNPSESFIYDADGNLTQDAMYDYTWDAENRLASVTPRAVITGSKKCVFTYDYMGRRVRKQVYTYSSGQWGSTPSTDLKYIYDGWNLILELNGLASDAVLRKYTWGLDLSGQAGNVIPPVGTSAIPGMHGAGGIGGLLAMRDAATSTDLLYLYDANGNVGQLIKTSDGSFGAKYQYYPYGGEIQAVGTYATVNPFRFSTKYWDTEHQALYYGYRYHKPKLGRWLSRDPIKEEGGSNLYQFVLNEPVGHFDLLGLQSKPAPYDPPKVSKCGAFLLCLKDSVEAPKDLKDEYEDDFDTSRWSGFEVIFVPDGWKDLKRNGAIDGGKGKPEDKEAYPLCECDCVKKNGTIRLVQVYQWRTTAGTTEAGVDNWKGGIGGKLGAPPPGMTPTGRTEDGRSFQDGPYNPSAGGARFLAEVCAFCTQGSKETNLGCITFSFNSGTWDQRSGTFKGRGFDRTPKPIENGEYKGCFLLKSNDPGERFNTGIENWRNK